MHSCAETLPCFFRPYPYISDNIYQLLHGHLRRPHTVKTSSIPCESPGTVRHKLPYPSRWDTALPSPTCPKFSHTDNVTKTCTRGSLLQHHVSDSPSHDPPRPSTRLTMILGDHRVPDPQPRAFPTQDYQVRHFYSNQNPPGRTGPAGRSPKPGPTQCIAWIASIVHSQAGEFVYRHSTCGWSSVLSGTQTRGGSLLTKRCIHYTCPAQSVVLRCSPVGRVCDIHGDEDSYIHSAPGGCAASCVTVCDGSLSRIVQRTCISSLAGPDARTDATVCSGRPNCLSRRAT